MKIAVLNGSPKGLTSVTMQYVHFVEETFPQHELKIHSIAQRIRQIESDDTAFDEIIDDIKAPPALGFPLYYFHQSADHRTRLPEEGRGPATVTAVLTTSVHNRSASPQLHACTMRRSDCDLPPVLGWYE
jgi:hypothetical protein